MTNYDEQLKQLRQQVSRQQHLEKALGELYTQRSALKEKVSRLEAAKLDEQADVDRLEGRSLAAFFYNVVGKMDEKLDQERQEAYAAAVKYDAAARELAAVEEDIRRYEDERRGLLGSESRYEELLAAKLAALKGASTPVGDEIRALESRIAYLEHQMDEIDEAMAAGNAALSTAQSVLSSLDSAEGFGVWDMMGGGLIADIAKHSRLDDAQYAVERLQVDLRRFKTELADVSSIHVDTQVNIDGFLRFADYFFDGLFADWAVMDRISQSKGQVNHTVTQIQSVLRKLSSMMADDQAQWKKLHDQLDELVLKTNI